MIKRFLRLFLTGVGITIELMLIPIAWIMDFADKEN